MYSIHMNGKALLVRQWCQTEGNFQNSNNENKINLYQTFLYKSKEMVSRLLQNNPVIIQMNQHCFT